MKERVHFSVAGIQFEADYDPCDDADVQRFVEHFTSLAATLKEQNEKEGVVLELKVRMTRAMSDKVKAQRTWQQPGVTSVQETPLPEISRS